jgi:multiple sugar transport system substrate-binding protein
VNGAAAGAPAGRPRARQRAVRATTIVAGALAALLLAGCGGGGGSSGSTSGGGFALLSASDRAGKTLDIYGFGPGDDVATTRTRLTIKALAPAKVENPAGSYDAQRFLTRLASGVVPDVVYLDRQQVGTLAAKGVLRPLDDCARAQHIDLSQYRKAALDEASYGGKLYALPEFTNQRTLIVNLDAVHAAGLELADVSTTNWDKLQTVAKRMTKVQGGKLRRIGFDPKVPEFFLLWARANGARLLSRDGLHPNLDDPKAVEALAFTKSLIDAQGGWNRFKSFRDTWDFFGSGNQVAKDQIGAWPMESWYWNVMAENSPQVHVAAVPFTDRQGRPLTFFSGNGWAIPTGAKNPSLACTWMKTMTSVGTWLAAARKRAATAAEKHQPFTGLYTANAVADRKILQQVYKPISPQWDRAVKLLVDVQQHAVSWPSSPAGARIQQALTDAITRVLVGQQTPKAALARAQREAERALEDQGS